ncbi:hypothetical protein SCNU_01845 [Gordonia neofelifaecis NRRL B-59395]|uniref:Uncharacterized protein n=2 Tax=Gordonia TaxID=2053 RepID=F1YDY9_9ACTN|nr:hypothetical protein SCNU_01845 [Gordonia neofelifaecis NRRL B-59395]
MVIAMEDSNPTPDGDDLATPPAPARPSRRLIWVLAGVAAVLVLALAAGIGLMLGQRDSGSSGPSAVEQLFAPKPESLRSAAERMNKEGDAIEAAGSSPIAQKKFVEHWAEPSCAAMINAFVEAFAGSEDDPATPSAPSRIVSVNESEDKGTVITESAGETETQHWVRLNGRWMITCEGAFGDDSSSSGDSSTPTQADVGTETTVTDQHPRLTKTPRSEPTDHQPPAPVPSTRSDVLLTVEADTPDVQIAYAPGEWQTYALTYSNAVGRYSTSINATPESSKNMYIAVRGSTSQHCRIRVDGAVIITDSGPVQAVCRTSE